MIFQKHVSISRYDFDPFPVLQKPVGSFEIKRRKPSGLQVYSDKYKKPPILRKAVFVSL
jgi:hypothetical protein